MSPTAIRLSQQIRVTPQYKYYLRRIPDFAMWATGIACFFGWPHVMVDVNNKMVGAPGNRGFLY